MDFNNFTGVFGVYEGTDPIEEGSAGLADRNFSVLNDPAFSYQTASGTKGFTAAVILSLISKGQMSLDDSAKDILKRAKMPQRYGTLRWLEDSVTVRSLLQHVSGVPDYFDEEFVEDFYQALRGDANYHYDRPERFFPLMEAAWKETKVPYASRGSFKYSNGGFVILAALAETVTGKRFPEVLSESVFEPFGMQKSGLFRLDGPAPGGVVRATSYQADGRSNIYAVPVIGGGDGGAYTNPRDMAFFWRALDPQLHPESPFSSLIEEAWSIHEKGEDGFYGLGFWISEKNPRVVFLEGFDPGVQFFSYYNRDTKRSFTVCLNDEKMNCDEVFRKYFSLVEQ